MASRKQRSRSKSEPRVVLSDGGVDDVRTSRLRQFGVAVLCAKVALVPLVFDLAADWAFTVPKTLLSHGLAYVLVGVMVGLFVRFGRAFVVRSWLHVPVLAFLAANVAATAVAVDPALALYGTHTRMLGLGTIADWVVLYFATALLIRTRAEAVAVIACGLGASLLVLAYEAVQFAGKDVFAWFVGGEVRPFSTIGQPTSLAEYLTVIAVGTFALGVLLAGLRRPVRVLLILYAGILLAGATVTGTRSAVVGLVTGSTLLVLLIWMFHPSRRARWMTALGALIASLAVIALVLLSPLGARLTATVQTAAEGDADGLLIRLDPSTDIRLAIYRVAFQELAERPALGYGPDNFVVGFPKYRPGPAPEGLRQVAATSAHSWVAYVATSGGLIGLFSFIAIIAVALVLVMRTGFHPIALTGVSMLAAFLGAGLTTITDISVDALFWTSAGAVAAATAGRASPTAPLRNASRARRGASVRNETQFRSALALLCVAVGVFLLITTWSAYDAARSNRLSANSRLVGNLPEAIESGLRATRSDPGRAEYWDVLGLAYAAGARWRDASSAFERANKLAPHDVRYVGDLVATQLILASDGDPGVRAKALQLADQATRTDPNNPAAQLTRATVMQATGNLPEARRSAERALALDPESTNSNLYVLATQVALDSGSAADAVEIARRGIAKLGATPKSVDLRYELARALVANGQPRDALTEIDAALAITPNNARCQQLRAEIRARLPM